MTFDDFEVGAVLGRVTLALERRDLERWSSLYPRDGLSGATMPLGYVCVIVMRAYMQVCPVRPPGNIHGEQSFDIIGMPEIGSMVTTEVVCVDKAVKRDRKWLKFETSTRSAAGDLLIRGVMTIAWAQ